MFINIMPQIFLASRDAATPLHHRDCHLPSIIPAREIHRGPIE